MAKKVTIGVGTKYDPAGINEAKSGVTGLDDTTQSASKSMASSFALVAAGITATVLIIRKAAREVGELIEVYGVQEDAEKSLSAAIKSTGRETEISAKELQDLAASLQRVTRVGDEATISAIALTQQLANLDQDGLEKVTPALLDFAAGMRIDLQTAASLVGKTLGSATNALSRYGIEIDATAGPTEKLAQLTEQINLKFGGTAEALAETNIGRIEQYRNAIGDLKEDGGELIADFLAPAIINLTEFVTGMNDARKATKDFQDAFDEPGGTTAEDLLAVDEAKFERYKANLEAVIGLSRQSRPEDIASTLVAIAESEGLALGVVADIAVEMGIITQELLKQNDEYANFLEIQERSLNASMRDAGARASAAEAAKLFAELTKLGADSSELIAGFSAEFFPPEALTRIEEINEAIDELGGLRNIIRDLGGDFSGLRTIINELDALRTELVDAEKAGSLSKPAPANSILGLIFDPAISGQIAAVNTQLDLAAFQLARINKINEDSKDRKDAAGLPGALVFADPSILGLTKSFGLALTDIDLAFLAVAEATAKAAEEQERYNEAIADILTGNIAGNLAAFVAATPSAKERREARGEFPAAAGPGFLEDAFGGTGLGELITGAVGPMAALVSGVQDLVGEIAALGLILNPISTIFKTMGEALAPLVNTVLAPLVGVLVQLGLFLASVFAPIFKILAPIITKVAELFVWLYNVVLRPIGNLLIGIFNTVSIVMTAFINAIIQFTNVFRKKSQQKDFVEGVGTVDEGFLEKIDFDDLVRLGGTAIEGAGGEVGAGVFGGATTVRRVPDIHITQNFHGPVVTPGNGLGEFGELTVAAIQEFAGIGGDVTFLVNPV